MYWEIYIVVRLQVGTCTMQIKILSIEWFFADMTQTLANQDKHIPASATILGNDEMGPCIYNQKN